MITVLELRELLLEFITAVETHEWVMDSVKTSGDYKDGQWHNQNAFEIHQKLCDEIGSKIPFTDYMNQEFMDWLESVTHKIDYSLQDLAYFKALRHHFDLAIEYGYADKVIDK